MGLSSLPLFPICYISEDKLRNAVITISVGYNAKGLFLVLLHVNCSSHCLCLHSGDQAGKVAPTQSIPSHSGRGKRENTVQEDRPLKISGWN